MITQPEEVLESLGQEERRALEEKIRKVQEFRRAGHPKKRFDILSPFERPAVPMEQKNPVTRLHRLGEHVEF